MLYVIWVREKCSLYHSECNEMHVTKLGKLPSKEQTKITRFILESPPPCIIFCLAELRSRHVSFGQILGGQGRIKAKNNIAQRILPSFTDNH